VRISSIVSDPGYRNFELLSQAGYVPVVRLDGRVQRQCILADTEVGVVVRNAMDDYERLILTRAGQLRREMLNGRVEITVHRPSESEQGE